MCTCRYLALSYRSLPAQETRAVVARAELLKDEKYSDLIHKLEFTPVAVESSGVCEPRSLFFNEGVGKEAEPTDWRREGGLLTLSNDC